MAEVDISGFDGAVTLPSGHGGAAAGFTIRRTSSKKNTNRYGTDRFSRGRLGIVTIGGTIRFFLRKGAASTSPGFIAPAADGAALTLTLSTGCTIIGTALFEGLDVDHTFEDPAVEGTHNYEFSGVVAEAWSVS